MDDHDRWFTEQVLPLEGALTRYLRRAWRDPEEIADLRQEVYVRVYEAARLRRPAATNAYVFAVARNLLIDRIRQSRVVAIDLMADLETLNVMVDEVPADRVLSGRQELVRLERAMEELPPRCRETLLLRKVHGLSQRETAERMGVTEHTIEKQIGKGMRLLANLFWGGEEDRRPADGGAAGADDREQRG